MLGSRVRFEFGPCRAEIRAPERILPLPTIVTRPMRVPCVLRRPSLAIYQSSRAASKSNPVDAPSVQLEQWLRDIPERQIQLESRHQEQPDAYRIVRPRNRHARNGAHIWHRRSQSISAKPESQSNLKHRYPPRLCYPPLCGRPHPSVACKVSGLDQYLRLPRLLRL